MPIAVTCPHCQATGKVPDAAAGKLARCPRCRGSMLIPVPPPVNDLDFFSQSEEDAPSETFNPFDPATTDLSDGKREGRRTYRKGDQFNPFDGETAEDAADEPAEGNVDDGRDPFDYSESVNAPPPPSPDQALKFGSGPRRR